MYFKRIIISVIVIGCLVQFITCPGTSDDRKQNSKGQNSPTRKTAPQNPKKPGGNQPTNNYPAARPRGLPTNNNTNPRVNGNAKSPTKPAIRKPMRPPAPDKNKEIAENHAEDDEELAKEKSSGRIRRTISRMNNLRKKISPFRFIRRMYRKIKPKLTYDEEPEP